jgi:RimJ/RimL family protein N-acetyltransferase
MSESVYLRPFEPADAAKLHRWHNDSELYRSLLGKPNYPSLEAVERWIAAKRVDGDDELNLAVCVKGDGRYIGNAYLRDIDHSAAHAELHLFIGDRAERSRGYGEAAVRQLLDRAFGGLGLRRVFLHVLADNAAAIRVYEKCGFEVERRLRGHARKGGEPKDVLVMGVRRPDGRLSY